MTEITFREALREGIAESMREDSRVFLLGEEVAEFQGAYGVSYGLLNEFGSKRVIDSPITEHGFAGLGVGAAFAGLRPIIEFMTFNFAMQAIDQIVNSAAKTKYMSGGLIKCPIVFRGPNGVGSRVAAQHSQCYAAWYSSVPGLKVISPYFAEDAKALIKASVKDENPVVFLENELLYNHKFPVKEPTQELEIGKARIVQEGNDVTLVSFSLFMHHTLQAAKELKDSGIQAEVIDLCTIQPMDFATIINSVKKTNRLVTVEGGWQFAGIGVSIATIIMQEIFDYLDAPILNITGKAVPMPYAVNLEELALPRIKEIIDACKQVCYVT
ncbi:MAG: pyruvate dehydrogenase complex E1 component subunit beta [Rickettsiales bacterium]|nr:pyruvate dehydrogenase complex E1 component subunit beta [Rickettsiales bacterium]